MKPCSKLLSCININFLLSNYRDFIIMCSVIWEDFTQGVVSGLYAEILQWGRGLKNFCLVF